MTFNFTSFGDDVVWVFAIQFFILAAALLIGNILRRKVPFFRKSLMPSALIGGTLILLLKLIPGFKDLINQSGMEIVTYHCLAIGFIALALKRGKEQNKAPVKTILETGILQGAVYSMQAVVGLIVTIILCVTLGFFPGGGVLLALGFGQGTGQALNFGSSFENQYGFAGGATFGLTIATVGFFVACIVGVAYMNILRRRGKLKVITAKTEDERLSDYVTENEIPRTESVDRLTINLGLVFLVYGLVYLVMRLVNVTLVWGFNFLLGSIFAMLCKLVLNQFRKRGLMHREIVNDYLLDRISGIAFDTMIIAGVAAINLDDLSNMWWQLCIICALGTVTTFVYIRLAANELYKGYEHEAFFSLFGMLTGTASNGVILLREIDPSFETPAATNLVMSGLPAIIFGGGLLLVLDYCPRGLTEAIISCAILLAGFLIFSLILFRRRIFKKHYAKKAAMQADKKD